VFGGPKEQEAAPKSVHVHWRGEPVDTAIVQGAGFRRPGWLGEFLSRHRLQTEDGVVLERNAPCRYAVNSVRGVRLGTAGNGLRRSGRAGPDAAPERAGMAVFPGVMGLPAGPADELDPLATAIHARR
jgi:hypothetical protein